MDANEYPISYIMYGHITVFVSPTEKAWMKIEDHELIEDNLFVTKSVFKILTVDMEPVPIIIQHKVNKYHVFMKEYMLHSDKSIPYKTRFKEAITEWHLVKSVK
jgi:hypothetical protein